VISLQRKAVRSVAFATHSARSKHKFMLFLTAYVDESGHSVDPRARFVGLGGLVAPVSRWEKFTDQWGAALDEFIGGQEFHMKEFILIPGIGPYVGWDENRRQKFMGRLIAAIIESEAAPVAAIVSLDARDALHPTHQEFFGDPYFTAFQQVTRGLSLAALPREVPFEPETVSMVYAYQKDFGAINSGSDAPQNQGRAESLWHAMKEKTIFGQWMGAYSSDTPKNMLPLQAADLFAYEITHEFENQLKRPELAMRWPLKQILSKLVTRQPLIKLFTLDVMIETLIENGVISPNGDDATAFGMSAALSKINVRQSLMERARA